MCVGGAGAGAEPTPPALTHSAPQPGRSVRCLLFCSAPTAPGSPHPPRLSYQHRRPEPAGTPPPGFPAQTRRPVPPGPPAGCRGYNGAAGRRDLTFHGGRGGRPPPRPRGLPPRALPGLAGKRRATGQRTVLSRLEAARPHLPFSPGPCAPSPNVSRGCRGETGPPASCGGMEVEGSHRVSPLPIAPKQ